MNNILMKSLVRPEDIEVHPCKHLTEYGSDHPQVQHFAEWYLRPIMLQRHGGVIEIARPGFQPHHLWFTLLGVKPPTDKPTVPDPIPYLDHWLYQVMKGGTANLTLPSEIVYGFSNIGHFYETFNLSFQKGKLLSPDITYPPYLVVETPKGSYLARPPESPKESLLCFLYFLRETAAHLAIEPIGKRSTISTADMAHLLSSLQRRTALIRSGDAIGHIQTYNTPEALQGAPLAERLATIQAQTREKYCRPKAEVEQAQLDGSSPSQPPQPKPRWRVNE